VKARVTKKDNGRMDGIPFNVIDLFKCPDCGNEKLEDKKDRLYCPNCKAHWAVRDGIHDFREKV
jgi:rubredoxin